MTPSVNQQLRKAAKKTLRSVVPDASQRWHRGVAEAAYRGIISNPGVSPLSAATKRKIRDYAAEVLGSPHFTPWLEVFTAYQGEFREGWIPEDYFERRVLPKINGEFRTFGTAKTLSRRILATDLLPDIAYCVKGQWLDTHDQPIPRASLKSVLFAGGDTVFAKAESTSKGKGIAILQASTFDPATPPVEGNFVVQRAVRQSPWFEQISPGCVATLRVTTAWDGAEKPQFTACHLRVGIGGVRFVISSSSLKIPIVGTTGDLVDIGTDPDWKRHSSHPDTGVVFKGLTVPGVPAAVEACLQMHAHVPHLGVIGWDCAITESGATELLEWNTRYPGVKFGEASVGPTFLGLNFERFAER
jgi:hypothetical protein